jgi:hypothetical protein
MLLGSRTGFESAEIFALSSFRICFFGIQPVFAALQLANHALRALLGEREIQILDSLVDFRGVLIADGY